MVGVDPWVDPEPVEVSTSPWRGTFSLRNVSNTAPGWDALARSPDSGSMRTVTSPSGWGRTCSLTPSSATRM